MQRSIKFEKFRNIGLDKPQYLVLNKDFNKGKMGNLLVIIGSNNSGKSNILDGIMKISNGKIEKRDVNTFLFEDKFLKPSISLCYKNDEINIEYVKDLESNGKWEYNILSKKEIDIDKNIVIEELNIINKEFINYSFNRNTTTYKKINSIITQISIDSQYKFEKYRENIFNLINDLKTTFNNGYYNNWHNIENKNLQIVVNFFENNNVDNVVKKNITDHLGINPIPSVFKYEEKTL